MNFTPYEMTILLQVHSGMELMAPGLPLFDEAMADFLKRGLVRREGFRYTRTDSLDVLMQHVLGAPRPVPAGQREPLTERQAAVFVFLMEHIKSKQVAPTQREIADHFGFQSPNAAQDHLQTLHRKGYIVMQPGKARAIRCIP